MIRPTRLLSLAAPLVVATTLAAACSSSSSSSNASGTSGAGATTTVAVPHLTGTLNGSGSTFQQPYDEAVIAAFDQASGATVNYQGVGSGTGQTQLGSQVVDFAGSDVTESATQVAANKGGSILYFPIVVGPITVSYNLSGVSQKLQLSGSTIAKIFAQKITTWNDPAVAADNPGVTLPSTAITVVHRSDSSGTTANFTEFLTKTDPTDWTLGTGKTVQWGASTQAGNGNPGVANAVKATNGAIGYVDYSDASTVGLTWAKVKNAAGSFVDATLSGASAAAGDATVNANLTFDPVNAPGASDYPITSPTFIITYANYSSASTVQLVQAFLNYTLGPAGQALASTNGFAALPQSLDTQALTQVMHITG